MYAEVHPSFIMLRGDEGYNPRDVSFQSVSTDLDILLGVYRDDGPGSVGTTARPDRPFRFLIPRNADYGWINMEVWRRLQRGESLMDLDFSNWPRC